MQSKSHLHVPAGAFAALVSLLLSSFLPRVLALPDGNARTPPMGFNSWTGFGCAVTAHDLVAVGEFFISSGLAAKGYEYVNVGALAACIR